jgi:protein-S-isoprenylcysteine O-methyltransferase Ste14
VKVQRRHAGRDDLAGEHRWGDLGQLILLFIFLGVWVLDSFIFNVSTFLDDYIPWFIQVPLAVFVLFWSGYLAQKGMKIIFGEKRKTPIVVVTDVFGIVRHPIYLASILFYLGMILFTFSLFSVGVWIIIIIFYHLISKYEERLLLKKFGKEYSDYMQRVPMWIPRLVRKYPRH